MTNYDRRRVPAQAGGEGKVLSLVLARFILRSSALRDVRDNAAEQTAYPGTGRSNIFLNALDFSKIEADSTA